MLDLLSSSKQCVVAVVSGHQHEGGYFMDEETGIHHIVIESPLLTDPAYLGPFVVLEARPTALVVVGHSNNPESRLAACGASMSPSSGNIAPFSSDQPERQRVSSEFAVLIDDKSVIVESTKKHTSSSSVDHQHYLERFTRIFALRTPP